jgi:NTE family protein
LLEDGRLDIEAMSATSAGAMNAVVMAYGISIGGRDGARAKLAEFWKAISDAGRIYSPVRTSPWEKWLEATGFKSDISPSFMAFQAMTHLFSPYQFNPLNFNPLRDVLTRTVDFGRLQVCPVTTRLYLSATNVRTGKVKVFENDRLSADVVLASACLPYLFQAVEIDGEHYWDGGFMGNPVIFPLIYRNGSRDVVIVHINPIERKRLPTTAPEIFDRINEISFNSSLMREMRAIAFVSRLIDDGALDRDKYARMLIHSISDDRTMEPLGVASKLNPDWDFLCRLRDAGQRAASNWLDGTYDAIGSRSSVNLAEVFL